MELDPGHWPGYGHHQEPGGSDGRYDPGEQSVGKGSTFTVELELRVQEREEDPGFWKQHGVSRMIVADDGRGKKSPLSAGENNVLTGKTVLIVDDIAVNRMVLVKILTMLVAVCKEAENGQIAVDKFEAS